MQKNVIKMFTIVKDGLFDKLLEFLNKFVDSFQGNSSSLKFFISGRIRIRVSKGPKMLPRDPDHCIFYITIEPIAIMGQ